MKTSFETERLLLREFVPSDDFALFELDSDPEVHLFLGNNPAKTIYDSRKNITNIRQQYLENGIGRWAVFIKETGEFAGWSGLKVERNINGHLNFYDLGYRYKTKFWKQGIATEAAKEFIKFGFDELNLPKICAYVSAQHSASQHVLEKCGLQYVSTFQYEGGDTMWYEIHNSHLSK